MKKGKKDLRADLPPLKRLEYDTKLPRYFDLMWDIKYGDQIYENLYDVLSKEALYTALAEHGFDADSVRKWWKNQYFRN